MKLILVTGASRGLGLAIARKLSTNGFRIVAASRSNSEELAKLCANGNVVYEQLDLADHASLHGFMRRIHETHGPLYGLVNNAALGRDGVLATMPDSDVSALLAVNLTGTILLTKHALRPMLSRGRGRIVNISSVAATTGFSGLSVYAATKAGLLGFTRALAREVGPAGITVNVVSPGFLETEMSSGLDSARLESIKRRSPLGRLATVGEVADAVFYLTTPSAHAITGQEVKIDAGSSV